MIIDALESGKAEWAPPPMPATMKEVLETYEQQSAEMREALEGSARREVERHARVLRQPAPRVADGLELPLRHRAPPRADHDVPAADGIDRAADLRAERGRAVAGQESAEGRIQNAEFQNAELKALRSELLSEPLNLPSELLDSAF